MEWVILVYLTIHTNLIPPNEMRYRRLDFPAIDFSECIDITDQINDIVNRGRESTVPYVRSFYWVHNNMLEDIKAECIYGEPMAPSVKWEHNDPWLWRNLVEDKFLTPQSPPE